MPYHIDFYGVHCDDSNRAALEETPNFDPDTFQATDALSWHEYRRNTFNYVIPGHIYPDVNPPPGTRPQQTHFVTSPNAPYIPDLIDYDQQAVCVRKDGRFFTNDFAIFPQWYFQGTYYLPFVRKKPDADVLATDPYCLIWYDMSAEDFVAEASSLIVGYGRLNPEIVEKLTALRQDLRQKINDLVSEQELNFIQSREIQHCSRALLYASICLEVAPQTYFMTLLTLTLFQRLFLECLACYEYLTIWEERKKADHRLPVDLSIMGAYTCDILLAAEFVQLGVPVWLLRHCAALPKSMKVGYRVYPTLPEGCVKEEHGDLECVFFGRPSTIRNRACQGLRLQHVKLGHAAYDPTPADVARRFALTTETLSLVVALPTITAGTTSTCSNSPAPASEESLPSPPTYERWPTLKLLDSKAITPNAEKFRPLPSSPRCPPLLSAWIAALSSVNLDTTKILDHPNRLLFKGFAPPDPHMFASPNVMQPRLDRHLIVWLLLRPVWISYTTTRAVVDSAMPQSQHWKSFFVSISRSLGMEEALASLETGSHGPRAGASGNRGGLVRGGPSAPMSSTWGSRVGASGNRGGSVRGGPPPAKVRKARTPGNGNVNDMEKMFDFNITAKLADVYWDGNLVKTLATLQDGHLTLPEHILQQVVWDLYEQNFRLELLALDRSIFRRGKLTYEQAEARNVLVTEVFPDGVFVIYRLPLKDEGLGARNWQSRVQYVEAFHRLLQDWPQSPAGNFNLSNTSDLTEQSLLSAERALYSFYCHSFFCYFGRAPSVPHHLP